MMQREMNKTFKKFGKKIQKMPDEAQAVLNDISTDINIPFVVDVQTDGTVELRSKTIMRKKNFLTRNPRLIV